MKIKITMELDPELTDPDHPMGITEAGHDGLHDALGEFGSNIEVARDDEPT